MALRKLREVIPDGQTPGSRRLQLNVLKDSEIMDATTVIIGSELSVSERRRLTDDLLTDIRRMSERGDTIIAIAVASE
jgi:hypothetical protein